MNFNVIKSYTDLIKNKKILIQENQNKTGIYRWINNITLDTYIGSSKNLSRRFNEYLSLEYLNKNIKKNNSIIYRAILKYTFSNFTLEILEYINIDNLLEREQFYLNNLKPTYNICKTAGSSLGRMLSKDLRLKLKYAYLKRLYLKSIKDQSFSEFVLKRLEYLIEKSFSNINKWEKNIKKITKDKNYKVSYEIRMKISTSIKTSIPIEIFDSKTKISYYCSSIRRAAFILGTSHSAIRYTLKTKHKIYNNRYLIINFKGEFLYW